MGSVLFISTNECDRRYQETYMSVAIMYFLSRRFLNGSNFLPWFQTRRAITEKEQQRLWRQARMKADIHHFILKMSELEIVDSFNTIERHLLVEIQVCLLSLSKQLKVVIYLLLLLQIPLMFTLLFVFILKS